MAIESQVRTLEAQIATLKALLKAKRTQREKLRTLGDLRGLLKGKAQSSEEDIERAKLRFKWDDEEETP